MRTILGLPVLLLTVTGLFSQEQAHTTAGAPGSEWTLVFQCNTQGKRVHGEITNLIAAVRAGVPIRVGWASKRNKESPRSVEHVTAASFLTVLSGEVVVAQIEKIFGQRPNFADKVITFHDAPPFYWTAMFASNGKAVMMSFDPESGKMRGQQTRAMGTLWYALLPADWQSRAKPKPLWQQ